LLRGAPAPPALPPWPTARQASNSKGSLPIAYPPALRTMQLPGGEPPPPSNIGCHAQATRSFHPSPLGRFGVNLLQGLASKGADGLVLFVRQQGDQSRHRGLGLRPETPAQPRGRPPNLLLLVLEASGERHLSLLPFGIDFDQRLQGSEPD